MTRKSLVLPVALGVLMSAMAPEMPAQTARRSGGGDQAAARSQAVLQQLTAERARLQAENAKLVTDRDQLAKDMEETKQRLKSSQKDLKRSQVDLETSRDGNEGLNKRLKGAHDRIERSEGRLRDLIAKHKATVQRLGASESKNHELEDLAARQKEQIATLEGKNKKLYQAGIQLMDRYEDKGIVDALLQREPLTQIKDVEVQNVLEEYRNKLDDLKVENR